MKKIDKENTTAGKICLSDMLACCECGQKQGDVTLCDMTNHPFYNWEDDAVPLCNKCHDNIWDQI